MENLYFKACPKCGGDVVVDRDPHGRFFKCLQCGLLRDVAPEPVAGTSERVEVVPDRELEAA